MSDALPSHIPERLSRRWREPSREGAERLRRYLVDTLFAASAPGYLETDHGRNDLNNHLTQRLDGDRREMIPWLDSVTCLDGARVLEIGAGTGSSTLALAEQGARVTAIDVHEPSLEAARLRLDAHEVSAELAVCDAASVGERFAGERFDWIIFWACLEHLTHAERMISIRETWRMLVPGAHLCVIEAPNRLWYKDVHTSLLPFYHWLPDDLAFEYARLSPRAGFNDVYRDPTPEAMLAFLRRGRGVSFHEFDLALAPVETLNVITARATYERTLMTDVQRAEADQSSTHRFATQLAKMAGRTMHEGWFQPWLDIVIRK